MGNESKSLWKILVQVRASVVGGETTRIPIVVLTIPILPFVCHRNTGGKEGQTLCQVPRKFGFVKPGNWIGTLALSNVNYSNGWRCMVGRIVR